MLTLGCSKCRYAKIGCGQCRPKPPAARVYTVDASTLPHPRHSPHSFAPPAHPCATPDAPPKAGARTVRMAAARAAQGWETLMKKENKKKSPSDARQAERERAHTPQRDHPTPERAEQDESAQEQQPGPEVAEGNETRAEERYPAPEPALGAPGAVGPSIKNITATPVRWCSPRAPKRTPLQPLAPTDSPLKRMGSGRVDFASASLRSRGGRVSSLRAETHLPQDLTRSY